jgi:hypothetical protein
MTIQVLKNYTSVVIVLLKKVSIDDEARVPRHKISCELNHALQPKFSLRSDTSIFIPVTRLRVPRRNELTGPT